MTRRSRPYIAVMTDILEPFQKPVRRHRSYLIAGLAILTAAWGGYVGWQHHATAKIAVATAAGPSPAIPVSVTTAQRRDVLIYLTGLGTVQAFNAVTVKPRVDGELLKVAFTEGQDVKAGDLLAQIDPRPFQAAYDQAAAKKCRTKPISPMRNSTCNASAILRRATSPQNSKLTRNGRR